MSVHVCVCTESEEPVNISLPLCHTLYLSQALRAAFPLHPLGASGHLGAVVDALVTAPDPHFVSVGCMHVCVCVCLDYVHVYTHVHTHVCTDQGWRLGLHWSDVNSFYDYVRVCVCL